MIPEAQAATAALLRRITGAAEPIETHISAVFVGPEAALKLKKAVSLGFLDFTSLAAREHFARREFALNAPHAPGLYRDVLPVRREADGALDLGHAKDGTPGEVVDWVLRMAPVPAADFLDAVAARGELDPSLLDSLADAVAAMHGALPPISGTDAPAAMRAILEGNSRAAHAAGLEGAALGTLAEATEAWVRRLGPLLAARAAEGRVRRCHGDLHLGNLCLWQGRPTPFDALEFDEALATIDTGYDLAFLLMDLDHAVGQGAANRVLNRYLARTGDAGLAVALPLWLSLRALIRAHVEAARGGAAGHDPRRDPGAYLARAAAYLAPPPARIVAIGGLQGTGKSTLARALAPGLGAAPGALVLRSDEIRKRRHGVAPERTLGEDAYTAAASAAVFGELFAQASAVAAGGHAVIADASFLDAGDRAGIAAAAAAAGVPFTGLWLTAPLPVLRDRIAARRGDASDANVAVLEAAAARHAGAPPPEGWVALDAAGDPLPAALAALVAGGTADARMMA
jgi:hypothetical protein